MFDASNLASSNLETLCISLIVCYRIQSKSGKYYFGWEQQYA